MSEGDSRPRPVVHWEIVALDPERLRTLYSGLLHWEIHDGPIMWIPAAPGGSEPGPGGHIRQGTQARVSLFVQVGDLGRAVDQAVALGGTVVRTAFTGPAGETIATIADPEGNRCCWSSSAATPRRPR